MDKPTKALQQDEKHRNTLPSSFTRLQSRKLRPMPTRDPNAWRKLVKTSPPRYTTSVSTCLPSTSKVGSSNGKSVEDEDGLEVRNVKRARRHNPSKPSTSTTSRRFDIPQDDTMDEAMSGFTSLNLDTTAKPLQHKSNAQPQPLVFNRNHKTVFTFSKTSLDNDMNEAAFSSSVGEAPPPLPPRVIHTSTPPSSNDSSAQITRNDFASLEAANVSTIPRFRFLGKQGSESSMASNSNQSNHSSVLDFTFTGTAMEKQGNSASNTLEPSAKSTSRRPAAKLIVAPWNSPAFAPIPSSSSSGIDTGLAEDDDFADLLQSRLKFTEQTQSIPPGSTSSLQSTLPDPSTFSESQQTNGTTSMTATTDGQLASESEIDKILRPLPSRKRKNSKSKALLVNNPSSAAASLKARKKLGKNSRYRLSPAFSSSSVNPDKAIATGSTVNKGKNVSPSAVQSSKAFIVGLRGTRGTLIRNTPVKAGPEESIDELGLLARQ